MRFKAKFRPNLAEAGNRARRRKISGCGNVENFTNEKRIRTISGSSFGDDVQLKSPNHSLNESGNEEIKSPFKSLKSPEIQRHPSPPPPDPVLMTSPNSEMKTQRQRHLTDSKDMNNILNYPASVFDKRKADHKKKFNQGIPERTKMTMFDLIYYNPSQGSRMSNSSSRRASRASFSSEGSSQPYGQELVDSVKKRLEDKGIEEDIIDDDQENLEDAQPIVPQVKVGPNGDLIEDEESIFIETTDVKKAKAKLLKTPLIYENSNSINTNYGTWGKKRKSIDWKDRETLRFYRALSVFGTDFSMMESVFKKRSRQELKLKFKKEEKQNRSLVDKYLREGIKFDISLFDSDETDEEDEAIETPTKKTEKKKPTKRPKKISRKKRVYVHSEESNDIDSLEVAGKPKTSQLELNSSGTEDDESNNEKTPNKNGQLIFPPGLLAANPNLAMAVPGCLVVVDSPQENKITQKQMLHVLKTSN